MFNFFRLCGNDKISFDIFAKNGNNVDAAFDFVERIVRLVAFDNVASTLLLVHVDGALDENSTAGGHLLWPRRRRRRSAALGRRR